MFTLAHCSDWHATPPAPGSPAPLLGKRFFGWLSWNMKRGRVHRASVLEALLDDLSAQAPDHVAITGDLTNVALEHEFESAAGWLARLGAPSEVTVVPGNHDAYVRVNPSRSWDRWAPYLQPDDAPEGPAPRWEDYPVVRERGPVALVGLCSAQPTGLFRATGRLGRRQLERLESTLAELRSRGLFRVVLLHHPATDTLVGRRRHLVDGAALRAVLGRQGAELLLHGHVHRHFVDQVPGPQGPVPCVAVRSASHTAHREEKRAQYHLYEVARRDGGGFALRLRVRGYDPERGTFRDEGERALPGAPV